MTTKNTLTAAVLTLVVATAPAFAKTETAKHGKTSQKTTQKSTPRATQKQPEQTDPLYARNDRNRDGAVTRDEFPGDDKLFRQLDTNGDGKLTRSDVEATYPSAPAVDVQLRAYDANHDGVISRSEFPGNVTAFRQADRNGDGVISAADQFVAGSSTANAPRPPLDAFDRNANGVVSAGEWRGDDAAFRRLDLDRDGVLSDSELRARGRQ
jgi:Ca2+-binding EF-hand superfamily protein